MALESAIADFIKKHPSIIITDTKAKCELSGHEMPLRLDTLESYVKGKRYTTLRAQKDFSYEEHKQHLVLSTKRKHEGMLFCKLTWRHVNNRPVEIQRHIQGKRFKRALQRWQHCQETGEAFRPRPQQSRPGDDTDDEEDADHTQLQDDLSDLYPDVIGPAGDGSADDIDMHELDLEEAENEVTEVKDGNKRTRTSNDGQENSKKLKKRHRKKKSVLTK